MARIAVPIVLPGEQSPKRLISLQTFQRISLRILVKISKQFPHLYAQTLNLSVAGIIFEIMQLSFFFLESIGFVVVAVILISPESCRTESGVYIIHIVVVLFSIVLIENEILALLAYTRDTKLTLREAIAEAANGIKAGRAEILADCLCGCGEQGEGGLVHVGLFHARIIPWWEVNAREKGEKLWL